MRYGIASGVLAQQLGPYKRAVAFFSKQLDTLRKGWPACLRAVAAVVMNIEEARTKDYCLSVTHGVSCFRSERGPLAVFLEVPKLPSSPG